MTKKEIENGKVDCAFSALMGVATIAVIALLVLAGYYGFFYKNAQAATENCERYYEKAKEYGEKIDKAANTADFGHTWPATSSIANSLLYQNCVPRQNTR